MTEEQIMALLTSVRTKGARVWAQGGRLHCRAPKGALTAEDMDELRQRKSHIVALLERASTQDGVGSELESPVASDRVPLAFSQRAHWNRYRLRERPAIRPIACALHLQGPLSRQLLEQALSEVVRRQDALRTRVIIVLEEPVQRVANLDAASRLLAVDLSSLSQDLRERQIHKLIEEQILQPIDVAVGPLFEARLLCSGENDHVLVVTLEHMIADAVSLNILFSDWSSAYRQLTAGLTVSLPVVAAQLTDYAVWQSHTLPSWIESHNAYWQEHLAGYGRLRFPDEPPACERDRHGWGVVSVQIDKPLKSQLQAWSRSNRTTLVLTVFTAYVALVLRWCGASTGVIHFHTDGRRRTQIQHTIGYFAFVLNLRVDLREPDRFPDLLNRITQEYFAADEHADAGYFASRVPAPEWTRNSIFNWVRRESVGDLFGLTTGMPYSQLEFVQSMARQFDADSEPSMLWFDQDEEETQGELWFPRNRISAGAMERFGRHLLVFMQTLVRQPEVLVKDITLHH